MKYAYSCALREPMQRIIKQKVSSFFIFIKVHVTLPKIKNIRAGDILHAEDHPTTMPCARMRFYAVMTIFE